MKDTLSHIINYLKNHGRAIQYCDEPYMQFMAEWQDWSFATPGLTQLYLGYFTVDNGDTIFDPLLVFTLKNNDVTDVRMTIVTGQTLPATNDPYVDDFVETVWERHFMERQLT
jgi:hypothetical protein